MDVGKRFDEADAALRQLLKELNCPEDMKLINDNADFICLCLKHEELRRQVMEWREARDDLGR